MHRPLNTRNPCLRSYARVRESAPCARVHTHTQSQMKPSRSGLRPPSRGGAPPPSFVLGSRPAAAALCQKLLHKQTKKRLVTALKDRDNGGPRPQWPGQSWGSHQSPFIMFHHHEAKIALDKLGSPSRGSGPSGPRQQTMPGTRRFGRLSSPPVDHHVRLKVPRLSSLPRHHNLPADAKISRSTKFMIPPRGILAWRRRRPTVGGGVDCLKVLTVSRCTEMVASRAKLV